MKIGAMSWPGLITAICVCLIILVASRASADELQDRIVTALEAYRDVAPEYPDVFLGRAQILIDDAVRESNPSEIVKSTQIGAWLARNQPVDADPALRAQLVQWLGAAFKDVMGVNTVYATALPAQNIPVTDLQSRITTAIDKVMPGPSKAERAVEQAEIDERFRQGEIEAAAKRKARELERQWGRKQ